MYLPAIELDAFDTLTIPSRVIVLRRILDALAQTNIEWRLQNQDAPFLYEWAPKYKIKPRPYVPGSDQADIWQDIPATRRRGDADCKDLAAERVSELYLAGYTVGFHIKVQQLGDLIVYHIQIEGFDKNGSFFREDPSKLCGMPTSVTPQQLQAIITG
jgi:hypothetical protein